MSKAKAFSVLGRDPAPKPYRYTACGLDNVYLLNGFTPHKTSYGNGVSIDNLEELHRTIARTLIDKKGPLTAKELRFLRLELGLTQAEFARRLGTEEQNIGRYERDEFPIPGSVDKLARAAYSVAFSLTIKELAAMLDKQLATKSATQKQVFRRKGDEWLRSAECH